MMWTSDIIITFLLTVVLATLSSFSWIQYKSYNRKAVIWNRLNLFSGMIMAMTLCSIVPQYFVLGRSDAECAFLHRFAGTFTVVTGGLTKIYFLSRSNQVVPDNRRQARIGNAMLAFLVLLLVVCVFVFHAAVKTSVVGGVCIADVNQGFFLLFDFLIPKLCELVINVRFVSHIWATTRLTSGGTGSEHGKGPMRLLRVTCGMSVASMIVSLFVLACMIGLIPLADPSLSPLLITIEQVFEACATAWPAIAIRILKTMRALDSTNSVASSKSRPALPSPIQLGTTMPSRPAAAISP